MSAIKPNNDPSTLIDEFIKYAINHLNTVGGQINTISLYPPLNAPPLPGILPWVGYYVDKEDYLSAGSKNTPDEKKVVKDLEDKLNESALDDTDEEGQDINETDTLQDDSTYFKDKRNLETTGGVTGFGNGAPKAGGKKLTNNLDKGWIGHEVAFVRTIVSPQEWGPKLKKLYGENVAKCMLACMKNEQNFKGFNNNIGGYDITAGGWSYDPTIHDGFVYASEGTTGLKKAFCSFKSLDAFFQKTSATFIKRGADKITTSDEFSKFYYQKWLGGDSATENAFKNYPNIAKAKGGRFATLEDYRNSCKAQFKAIYTQVSAYVK